MRPDADKNSTVVVCIGEDTLERLELADSVKHHAAIRATDRAEDLAHHETTVSGLIVHQEQPRGEIASQGLRNVSGELSADDKPDPERSPLTREGLEALAVLHPVRLIEYHETLKTSGLLATQRIAVKLNDYDLGECRLDLVGRKLGQLQADLLVYEGFEGVLRLRSRWEKPEIGQLVTCEQADFGVISQMWR